MDAKLITRHFRKPDARGDSCFNCLILIYSLKFKNKQPFVETPKSERQKEAMQDL